MSEPTITVSAKRIVECHHAMILEDWEEAYNALYWAVQEMPNADPFEPFAHVPGYTPPLPQHSEER
jgi:hypothetical protein